MIMILIIMIIMMIIMIMAVPDQDGSIIQSKYLAYGTLNDIPSFQVSFPY